MIIIKALFDDQSGAAAVQYALVAVILTLAVMAGCLALRAPLLGLYQGVGDQAGEALAPGEGG